MDDELRESTSYAANVAAVLKLRVDTLEAEVARLTDENQHLAANLHALHARLLQVELHGTGTFGSEPLESPTNAVVSELDQVGQTAILKLTD